MSSFFSRNGGLSEQTREAYNRCGDSHPNVGERLVFYITYLHDVAPWGLTIHHIPADHIPESESRNGNVSTTREEIQLLLPSGRIFMSGLLSLERSAAYLETVAGDEAYTKWLDGYFVPDNQNWRFFTCLANMRIFNSNHRGDEWDLVGSFHPISHAQEVATLLQQEYNRLRYH